MKEKTYFAPALRSSSEVILNENELIESQEIFSGLFGSLTGIGAIINVNRQIVFANSDFLKKLGLNSIKSVLGKRLGEIISCVHTNEEHGGCGTARGCSYCGAVNAIMECQKTGAKTVKETLITTKKDGKYKSLDLNVISTRITLGSQVFYALIIEDISSEKRRLAMEKIFFHDLLNSAGGLNGLLNLLKDGTTPKIERQLIELSEQASRDIIDEIQLQRQICAAESGDLQVNIEQINSLKTIHAVIGKIGFHKSGQDKIIKISENSPDIDFETDNLLLQRAIINLLKNALEETPVNGTVLTGIEDIGEKICFWVKNDSLMPQNVQSQLFTRSFSTKGIGRGLGTYSVRLLIENYLHGSVSFTSNKETGTIFKVILNKVYPG
jgi:K+-sensing histidine kinase KdpD